MEEYAVFRELDTQIGLKKRWNLYTFTISTIFSDRLNGVFPNIYRNISVFCNGCTY